MHRDADRRHGQIKDKEQAKDQLGSQLRDLSGQLGDAGEPPLRAPNLRPVCVCMRVRVRVPIYVYVCVVSSNGQKPAGFDSQLSGLTAAKLTTECNQAKFPSLIILGILGDSTSSHCKVTLQRLHSASFAARTNICQALRLPQFLTVPLR